MYGSMFGGDNSYDAYGGRNPDPQYDGQCIMGENGYPLIGARVHSSYNSRGRKSSLQWRVAEVECGLAMDGALQDIVLQAANATTSNEVYVDDSILTQTPQDHLGAIKTALQSIKGRVFTFKSLKGVTPPDGAIVIHLATAADAADSAFVAGQPTKTKLFFQLDEALKFKEQAGYPTSWDSRRKRGLPLYS